MGHEQANTSFWISLASALIAVLALGWNILRDVILKARVKVSLIVGTFTIPDHPPSPPKVPDHPPSPPKIMVSLVNFGPGNIRLNGPPFLRRKKILRKTKYAAAMYDWLDPLSARFPLELEVGDEKHVLFRFDKDCFLKEEYTRIGVIDSFGRRHWAPKKHIEKAKEEYKKKFGKSDKKV